MRYSSIETRLLVAALAISGLVLSNFAIAGSNAGSDNRQKVHDTFVVVDAYGEIIGPVVRFWNDFEASVALEVNGRDTLAWLNRDWGFGMSWPPGPMLFFELPDCQGQIFARVEHVERGWMSPRVVIVPGFVPEGDPPSTERITYVATTPEPGNYQVLSHLIPEGYCMPMDPEEAWVWPVKKVKACKHSYDLHTCYPPPFELEVR